MKKVKILNVQFDVCTKDEVIARVTEVFTKRNGEHGKQIVTPNPEMLLEAKKNAPFAKVLNSAWMSIPDGIGILWASTFQDITKKSSRTGKILKGIGSLATLLIYPKFCRKIFPARITGIELMQEICYTAEKYQKTIFLLGAGPGVAQKTKAILEKKYPGLNIVGTFGGSPLDDDFPALHAMIAETRPTILFVAYGAPHQEFWIAKHLHQLPSIKIAMGVGGAFDFIAGVRKRAPKFMQKTGIEWLYRLLQEPQRLRRIWNATIKFPLAIIRR